MTQYSGDYEEIRSYLLGTLSEEDRQRTEEQLLTDSDFLEELLICEEELIDDYINDDLSAESRLRFEEHFLCTPERQEKIKFAFAFRRYTSPSPAPIVNETPENQPVVKQKPGNSGGWFKTMWAGQTPALRFAMGITVIAILGISVWLILPKNPTIATVILPISYGDRADGSTSKRIPLTPEVDTLKISLTLPDLPSLSRELRVEWVNDQRTPKLLPIAERDAKTLTVEIPTKELARGQHALRLYSINSDGTAQRINGDYFFTIE